MFTKVIILSSRYKDEKIAVKFDEKKNVVEIGGRLKHKIECEILIKKFFSKKTLEIKIHKNSIIRIKFKCKENNFYKWLDVLSGQAIKVKFVNSLERIMR